MVMRRVMSVMAVVALVMVGLALPALGEVKEGDNLGNLQFPKLADANDAKYLGVSGTGPFSLNQVGAPYVLVEVFATTCPHCVHQAPVLNNLYNMVNQDGKLGGKLKFIAVGAGDNDPSITMWRKQFKTPFPVLADTDRKFYDKVNVPGTPTTLVLDKNGKVVLAEIGAFESADEFMKALKSKVK